MALAGDGDEILVRPGTYVEAVTIARDVDVRGDGPIESIVIRTTEDGPSAQIGALAGRPVADQRYAILILDADATVTGLTFSGQPSAVVAIGGAPSSTGKHFEAVGLRQDYVGPG